MDRLSVFLTRRWPLEAEQALGEHFDVRRGAGDRSLRAQEIASALRSFDFVCPTVTDRIDAKILTGAPLRARAVCNFGAGIDHIDLSACFAQGVIVTNTPDVVTDDTADIAMLLVLMCLRRAGEGERLVRHGRWPGWAPAQLLGTSLAGKTIGIVGFGRVGQALAERAHRGFGMKVIYASPTPAGRYPESRFGARHVSLDYLVAEADVVSLHVPLRPSTVHLFDARRLARMKRSAVLINTARGEIVDEEALAAALAGRRLACAGLDVYSDEPCVRPDLLKLENVVLLPHLGSATCEARLAMGLRVLENLRAIAAGGQPPDRVA